MPRGDNPNSRANLIVNSDRTPKQRKKQAKKAGKASGESRRALSSFREVYQRTTSDDDLETILHKVMQMAKRGNLNALDRLLKISGEENNNDSDIDIVQEFLDKLKGGDSDD